MACGKCASAVFCGVVAFSWLKRLSLSGCSSIPPASMAMSAAWFPKLCLLTQCGVPHAQWSVFSAQLLVGCLWSTHGPLVVQCADVSSAIAVLWLRPTAGVKAYSVALVLLWQVLLEQA